MAAAPFVAAAAALPRALSTITGRVQTATIVDSASSALYTTTWTYSNPATNYLSETDSDGVVTGQPSGTVGTQPAVVTSQPDAAIVPAGLPTGLTTIALNISASLTSYEVSIGESTTVIGGQGSNGGASTTASSDSESTGSSGSGSSSSGSNDSSSSDSSDSSSDSSDASASDAAAQESGNAASSMAITGASVFGFGAFIAALL